MRPAYRCDDCVGERARCAYCRARRALAVRTARATKRRDGTCVDCTLPALDGQTRCETHRCVNNARSAAAHHARRNA